MKAELKSLDLHDGTAMDEFFPDSPTCFSYFLAARIGPTGIESADDFEVRICSTQWLAREAEVGNKVPVRFLEVTFEYDWQKIFRSVQDYVENCNGEQWIDVVECLKKFSVWEFEGYSGEVEPRDW